MKHLITSLGQELIEDNEEKIMAIRESTDKPWLRATEIGKKSQQISPMIVSTNGLPTITLISEEVVSGLQDGSSVGEYSSAPNLENLNVSIIESKEFGFPKKTIETALHGNLLLTKNIGNAMKIISDHGIGDVVDSITPGEVALIINHLRKEKKKNLAEDAYNHFEKFVYGSYAFTDTPKQYMERFDNLIEENTL